MNPSILYFKDPSRELFKSLIQTCKSSDIPISMFEESSSLQKEIEKANSDIIIDGILGFSFAPPLKGNVKTVIEEFKFSSIPIFSIDIPSGWNVNEGNIDNLFEPEYLISLTLPKLGVKSFKGTHFVGGRFIPKLKFT